MPTTPSAPRYGRDGGRALGQHRARRCGPYRRCPSSAARRRAAPSRRWAPRCARPAASVCSGHIGALTARPRPMARTATSWTVCDMPAPPRAASTTMSVVPGAGPDQQEPEQHDDGAEQRVEDERGRGAPRSGPGSGRAPPDRRSGSTSGSGRPRRTRRTAAGPAPRRCRACPTSSSSSRPTKRARAAAGSGRCRRPSTAAHRKVSSAVSTTSGSEMPSTPRWKRSPSCGIHAHVDDALQPGGVAAVEAAGQHHGEDQHDAGDADAEPDRPGVRARAGEQQGQAARGRHDEEGDEDPRQCRSCRTPR